MMKKYGILIVLMALIGACSPQNEKEKHQSSRNNVINVKNQIKEIDTENEVLIGNHSRATYTNDYLIIRDHHAWNGVIHLFDKTDFHYLTSAGNKGERLEPLDVHETSYLAAAERIFSFSRTSILAFLFSCTFVHYKYKQNCTKKQVFFWLCRASPYFFTRLRCHCEPTAFRLRFLGGLCQAWLYVCEPATVMLRKPKMAKIA